MPDHALSLADAGDSLSRTRRQSRLLLKPLLDFLPHTKPEENENSETRLVLSIMCVNMDLVWKRTCSCCRALTKAFFRRLVCSAFRAFFWLEVMHCSHRMRPLFSCFQWGVKSVLHWAQKNGSVRPSEPLILPATAHEGH